MSDLLEVLVMMAAPAAVLLGLRCAVKRQDREPWEPSVDSRQDWPAPGQDAVNGVGARAN